MVGTEEDIQFGILVFLDAHEIKFLRHFESKYDKYCIFLCELFLFSKKGLPSRLDFVGFFRNVLFTNTFLIKLMMILYVFLQYHKGQCELFLFSKKGLPSRLDFVGFFRNVLFTNTFLIKLMMMTLCFFTISQRAMSSLFCRLLPKYESIADYCQGTISSPKVSWNLLWWNHVLIKSQNYRLQPRTQLNSVKDGFMEVFWKRCI